MSHPADCASTLAAVRTCQQWRKGVAANGLFCAWVPAGMAGIVAGYLSSKSFQAGIRFVFSTSFVFNNMARFVLRFVFSTGTCFQQHPSFVFRFVFGYLCSLLLIPNNIPGSFFKIRYLFLFFRSSNAEKRSCLSGAAFALDCRNPCHGPVWKPLPHHTKRLPR